MDACMKAVHVRVAIRQHFRIWSRNFSCSCRRPKALVLGTYQPQEKQGPLILTPAARKFDQALCGQFQEVLKIAGKGLKSGKSRVLYGLGKDYSAVAVANLGKQDIGFCPLEQLEEGKENIRSAVGGACTLLRDCGETVVEVDPCGDAEAAAEGGILSLFSYDELKSKDKQKPLVELSCYTDFLSDRAGVEQRWSRGVVLAEAQNVARGLMESPANRLTPTVFGEEVMARLQPASVVVKRDRQWAECERMEAFLAVAQGSEEAPCFLEIDYQGGPPSQAPVALVGKGITFDTGGISLKPSAEMDKMRGDMGGAACVVGAILAASRLKLPLNIKGFIALCENMPSGRAVKPGDVVTARNGKTIQINNTDAEGRLILADALNYAETCKPRLIVDIATLTGAIDVALGAGATGVYTNCSAAWDVLQQAGAYTGDRMWRMPLFKLYKSQVTECQLADVNNIGKHSRSGGSCTAAAFLKEFVTSKHWVHLDIAGVMMNKDEVPYLKKGMSGRPTRTLIEFLHRLSKQSA